MKISFNLAGNRFGLIIFAGLIVFCLAQLSWWVVYQINLNRQLYDLKIDLLNHKIEATAERVNYDFLRAGEMAQAATHSFDGDPEQLRQCYSNILFDQAVAGYKISADTDRASAAGDTSSGLAYLPGGDNIIYLNPGYPDTLLNLNPGEIVFKLPEHHYRTSFPWIESDMFKITEEYLERLHEESTRGSIMFISEGGFFILIMIFGAYLIYRTLRRSENLKSQQVNFLQAVTHEFRTPLTSLRLYLETLEAGTVNGEEAEKLYGKMLIDCDRLDKMVGDVLEAGHLIREKYELRLTDTDLSADVRDCLNQLMPIISRQNGQVSHEIEENIIVRSNHQAMNRVIKELIDNALKYSPSNRRSLHISLSKSKKEAVLKITDTGFGIPNQDQKQIFERFYRIDSTRGKNVHGTGLGLYLVRQIIRAHGGSIRVDSRGTDQGSTFSVILSLLKP